MTLLELPDLIHLEISKALLNEVIPSLRGVAFDWDPKNEFVMIFFYHEGQLSDSIEEHYSCIDNEASTRFIFNKRLLEHDYEVKTDQIGHELPEHDNWVYLRKEPFVDP